jgi:iron complex outermembrane receptor protein
VPVVYDLTVPVGTGPASTASNWRGKARSASTSARSPTTLHRIHVDDGTPMLGASENTYNVGVWFENEMFNARVNYNYRSSFYSGLDRDSRSSRTTSTACRLVRLEDQRQLPLTLDAMNLNNPKTKYYAENKDRPRSIYENGRQYYLNFRFKY